jgi:hypothetical protein
MPKSFAEVDDIFQKNSNTQFFLYFAIIVSFSSK